MIGLPGYWCRGQAWAERMTVAAIIVSFKSIGEAQAAIERLLAAHLGEVDARVLNSAGADPSADGQASAPMIAPGLGEINVRPTDDLQAPDRAGRADLEETASAVIPPTGGQAEGVLVRIEMDDALEPRVRQILGQ